jgi:hypothetical protein
MLIYFIFILPAVVEVGDGLLGVLLPLELDEDVPHQVVTQVVAHVHLLHLDKYVCYSQCSGPALFSKQIRIRHFRSMGIRIQFGIRIQGFDNKNCKNYTTGKKLYF